MRRQHDPALRHSVIAHEASNRDFYRPLDLVEAMIDGLYLLDHEP